MARRSLLVFLLLTSVSGQRLLAEDSVTGRWTFELDVAAYERGTPIAAFPAFLSPGAPTANAKPARVVLDLTAVAGGAVVGTINGIQGTRWSGAGSPQGPVEIADGRVEDGRLSFKAWRFDAATNVMRIEGRLEGDALMLTIRRDGPAPYSTAVKATRVSPRPATTVWH